MAASSASTASRRPASMSRSLPGASDRSPRRFRAMGGMLAETKTDGEGRFRSSWPAFRRRPSRRQCGRASQRNGAGLAEAESRCRRCRGVVRITARGSDFRPARRYRRAAGGGSAASSLAGEARAVKDQLPTDRASAGASDPTFSRGLPAADRHRRSRPLRHSRLPKVHRIDLEGQ